MTITATLQGMVEGQNRTNQFPRMSFTLVPIATSL